MSKTTTKKSTTQTSTKKTTAPETVAQETAPAQVPAPTTAPVEVKENGVAQNKQTKAVKPTPKVEVAEEKEDKQKRYFKCVYEGKVHGRYSGEKPKQAANKAFTNIIRGMGGDSVGKKVRFQMKECTRGSNQKTSTYEGERVKLDKPLTIEIKKNTDKPKVIEYKFTNKINKVKEIQEGGDTKSTKTTKSTRSTKSAKKAKRVVNKKTAKKVARPAQKKVQKQAETKAVEAEAKAETKVEVKAN